MRGTELFSISLFQCMSHDTQNLVWLVPGVFYVNFVRKSENSSNFISNSAKAKNYSRAPVPTAGFPIPA